MCASQSAVDPLCLAQTSNRYVPAAIPLVFQVAVGVAPYDCRSDHAPPGGWTQNSYSAWGQPVAVPLSVTGAPAGWGETGVEASQVAPRRGNGGGGDVGVAEGRTSQRGV